VDISRLNIREMVLNSLRDASGFLFGRGAEVFGNIASFVINSVITLFTLFFLFREGRTLTRRLAAVMPLTGEQVDRLYTGISNAVVATMYGGLAVAIAQGTLTSIAFAALGIPSPILWGVVTAMFSLVPMVGSAAVWVPAALILIATGNWVKGLILVAFGAGVISTVDNLIRPYIIGGRVKLHTLLVFFAVLGGIKAFGLLGLFIGPVALAVAMALLGMLRDEGRAWQATWAQDKEQPATG
jgi:predicted PurR-regulated permease PerM